MRKWDETLSRKWWRKNIFLQIGLIRLWAQSKEGSFTSMSIEKGFNISKLTRSQTRGPPLSNLIQSSGGSLGYINVEGLKIGQN
jgi:hypothetical protein